MQRVGILIGIRPEKIEEYKRMHAAVWPGVLAKISDCNMRNFSIFLREPENLLFGFFEYHGEDLAADNAAVIAARQNVEVAAKASRTAAVIGHGHHCRDVRQILIYADKIEKRAGRIEELDFSKSEVPTEIPRIVKSGAPELFPLPRKLQAGE